MIRTQLNQDEVINEFVLRYNAQKGSKYVVTAWPDKIKRSVAQTPRDIDAIAEAPGVTSLAIEHTEIQTHHTQKRDDAYFLEAIEDLNAELESDKFEDFGLAVWIHYDGIQKGLDWKAIGSALRNYVGVQPFNKLFIKCFCSVDFCESGIAKCNRFREIQFFHCCSP